MAMLRLAPELPNDVQPFTWQRVIALPIFVVALGLYGVTLAPTVATIFDDSLEFQLVTYQLGIAHPTGYPLYTLLGWLFTHLPIGDVAYRVNLMSAVFGAVTVALVYLIGLKLAAQSLYSWPTRQETQPSRSPDQEHKKSTRQDCQKNLPMKARHPWAEVVAGTIGALALAISPIFWSQATVAEVYTLNAAFVAGVLWLLVRTRAPGFPPEKTLLPLAFLFSLSLTHHRTTLLLLPTILFHVWRYFKAWRKDTSRASPGEAHTSRGLLEIGAKLTVALAAPLLLYLYIPLRGHVGSLDGTYANTLAGFWRHVTASGYGIFIFQNPFGTERGVDFYFSLFLAQSGPLGVIAGLLGLVVLLRRGTGRLTGIAFITYFAFNLFYRVADIQVFFIPLFLIWATWEGVLAGWLLTGLASASQRRRLWLRLSLSLGVVLLFLGQSLALFRENWPVLDRSDDWAVYDYGLDVMSQPLEPDAAIVGILGEITLVRYFQITQGLRPDLLPIAADREAERLNTAARLMGEGKAVYLTRELPGAPSRWSLSALGPLIRVNPQPILEIPDLSFHVESSLTQEIALHGYAISRPPTHHDPSPARLSLIWQVLAPVDRELKVSARLVDVDGQSVAQADAVPVHFAYPTTAWRAGEFITDVYDLALPPTLQPGEYKPLIILYDPAQGAAEVGRLTLPPVYLPNE